VSLPTNEWSCTHEEIKEKMSTKLRTMFATIHTINVSSFEFTLASAVTTLLIVWSDIDLELGVGQLVTH
jgi:hypothetical protein